MSTPQSRYFQFGSGYVLFTPGQQPTANAVVPINATPLLVGTLQDASLEITTKVEELRGNLQLAEVLAAGDIDVKGKITLGRFNIDLFQQAFPNLGTAIATGIDVIDVKEQHVISAVGSPPAEQVTVTNSVNFDFDLGVSYANGTPLLKVASAPAAGQYSVSAGVYTFNVADLGATVLISYSYAASTVGRTLTLSNSLQGATNYNQLILDQPFSGNNSIMLNNVVFSSFKMPEKRSGFTIIEMDFVASADANGVLGRWFQGISG